MPITKLEAGLQSQRTAAAISSARPRRPIGWFSIASDMSSSPFSIMLATIGVSIVPGQTVDANASGCIFERGALGEANDAVFRGVIRSAAGEPDETAEGRAVDDRAGVLRPHLSQLMFQAGP